MAEIPFAYGPWCVHGSFITEVVPRLHQQPVPEKLYHYTDAGGLAGIMKGKLWLTHFAYLNDSKEIDYGIDLAMSRLHHFRSNADGDRFRLLDRTIEKLEAGHLHQFCYESYAPFVMCFCEKGDLLSQWRAYAADAAGFSLGFDTSQLATSADKMSHPWSMLPTDPFLVRVEYSREIQIQLVDDAIGFVLEEFERAHAALNSFEPHTREEESATPLESAIGLAPDGLAFFIFTLSLQFKSDGFEEEKEWRLVQLVSQPNQPETKASPPMQTRMARGRFVPYLEIGFPRPG